MRAIKDQIAMVTVASLAGIISLPSYGATGAGVAEIAANAIPQATVNQWVKACNSTLLASQRLHQVTTGDVRHGLSLIAKAGDTKALAGLETGEACLSLAASAAVGRSVVVVTKSIENSADIHPGIVASNPTMAKSMTLARRLDRLDPAIHDPEVLQSDLFQEVGRADPGLAKSIFNNAYAQNIQIEKRSFSLHNDNAATCLIVLEPTSALNDFLALAPPTLTRGLSENDRAWLSRYDKAVEFWHEVGHCQLTEDLQQQAELAGVEIEESADSGTESCSAMESASLLVTELTEEQSLLERASSQGAQMTAGLTSPALGTQASPVFPADVAPKESDLSIFHGVIDNRLLLELSMETLMDRYALSKVSQRFEIPESGCLMSTEISHPWDRLRALWSIGDPDIHYMSWLSPWLVGQPSHVRRQVLADAWAGLLQAKKTASGRAFYQDWMLSRLSEEKQSGEFHTPTLTANPERAQNWQQWLVSLTQRPMGLQDAFGRQ